MISGDPIGRVLPDDGGLDDAERYVAALTGDPRSKVTFQTFPDGEGDSSAPPAILHASVREAWDHLCDLQDHAHGVFLMVNEGDGRGRAAGNVRGVRALFADDDSGKLGLESFPLPPDILVASGRGVHPYWIVRLGEPLAAFTPAQRGIAARFGTDPKVSDLARVLRLPGTFHLKDRSRPRLVRLLRAERPPGELPTIGEVLAKLGAEPARSPRVASARTPPPPVDAGRLVLGSPERKRAEGYVAKIHAVQGEGGEPTTFRVACHLIQRSGLNLATAWDVFRAWNRTNAHPPWCEYGPDSLRVKFENAMRYVGGPAR